MTLETAKRILEELPQDNKERFNYRMKNYTLVHEAEAVCRGGFTFCEHTEDRGRKYVWVKVFPTDTDAESSVKVAMEKRRRINKEQLFKPEEKQIAKVENNNIPSKTQTLRKETVENMSQPSFIERIKLIAKEIWKEIDSIVIE